MKTALAGVTACNCACCDVVPVVSVVLLTPVGPGGRQAGRDRAAPRRYSAVPHLGSPHCSTAPHYSSDKIVHSSLFTSF